MSELTPAFMTGSGQSVAMLLLALVGDAMLAGLPAIKQLLAAPTAVVEGLTGWFDRRLNRERRAASSRAIRGAVVVLLIAGAAGVAGHAAAEFAATVPDGWIIETVLVGSLLLQRRAFDTARAVGRSLRRGAIEAGRSRLEGLAGYDTAALDTYGVARGAIETCAVKFCDGVVAPAFWYLLLGLPGLCVYRAVNVMAGRIGHPSPRHAAFGATAARLDKVLNYLPAPISGAILACAALFVPAASPLKGLRTMFRESRGRLSPSEEWSGGAVAGALGLALAGPRRYAGTAVAGPWIGGGRARATAGDLGRAVYLFAIGSILTAAIVALIALARAPI